MREREREACSLLSADTNSDALPARLGSARRVLKPRSTCNGGDLARYVNTERNYQSGGPRRRRILIRRIISILFSELRSRGIYLAALNSVICAVSISISPNSLHPLSFFLSLSLPLLISSPFVFFSVSFSFSLSRLHNVAIAASARALSSIQPRDR